MKYQVISKGNSKNQRHRNGEGKDGPGRNPGGAMVIVTHDGGNRETRHLRYSNGQWTDRQGFKYQIGE